MMDYLSSAKWFKSSRSGASRNCVEVAFLERDLVGVRDSIPVAATSRLTPSRRRPPGSVRPAYLRDGPAAASSEQRPRRSGVEIADFRGDRVYRQGGRSQEPRGSLEADLVDEIPW